MTDSYDIGDSRRFSVAFTDINGAAADPSAIAFKMVEPDGTETSYVYGTDSELVKDSLGNYHVDWVFSKAGRHIIRFEGTGAVTAAEQDEVYVRRGV